MSSDISPPSEVKNLRFLRSLRLLTSLLMITMIAGFILLITLFFTRFQSLSSPPPPPLPAQITLPEGVKAHSATYGPDFFIIISEGGEILLFDPENFALIQRISINTETQ